MAHGAVELQPAALSQAEGLASSFKPSTRWRVVNLQAVSYGWTLGEVRMFSDPSCSDSEELTVGAVELSSATDSAYNDASSSVPIIEASGHHGDASPGQAFDGNTWTEWRAPCFSCEPLEAWLSLRFAASVNVRCIKLWQWGEGEYRTPEAALERWEASTGAWQRVLTGKSLGSGRWDTLNFVYCGELDAPENGRVEVTNDGYHPSVATFSCTGARFLSGWHEIECSVRDGWTTFGESGRRCWTLAEIMMCFSAFVIAEVTLFGGYLYFKIRPKDKWAPPLMRESFIPEERLHTWSNDFIIDVQEEALPQMMWFIFCPFCRIADTWRAAGLVPFGVTVVFSQICCWAVPCAGAWLRGSMRSRFGIRSTRSVDLVQWVCCMPCVAAQEAKHVEDLCEVAYREGQVIQRDIERRKELEAKVDEALAKKHEQAAAAKATEYGAPTQQRMASTRTGKNRNADRNQNFSVIESGPVFG